MQMTTVAETTTTLPTTTTDETVTAPTTTWTPLSTTAGNCIFMRVKTVSCKKYQFVMYFAVFHITLPEWWCNS